MSDTSGAGWGQYAAATAGRPPRKTVLTALAGFAQPGFAVDLGCGGGRDTLAMLERGWRVLAIDRAPEAIAYLAARTDLPPGAALETRVAALETAQWPPADLVVASFVLPMLGSAFDRVWARIRGSLMPGGRFAGHLFGERDSFAGRPGIAVHTRVQAQALLDGLVIELFEEEESDGVTPRGTAKHWHVRHIVARR